MMLMLNVLNLLDLDWDGWMDGYGIGWDGLEWTNDGTGTDTGAGICIYLQTSMTGYLHEGRNKSDQIRSDQIQKHVKTCIEE